MQTLFQNEIFEILNNYKMKYLKRLEITRDRKENECLNFNENFKFQFQILNFKF